MHVAGMSPISPFIGKWRIEHMDVWGQDFVDLVTEGHFTFERDGTGMFEFGAVTGDIDWKTDDKKNKDRLHFSWLGDDDGEEKGGRGWAEISENGIKGCIYFHRGDHSLFKARRVPKPRRGAR